jgi:hypothetical protein
MYSWLNGGRPAGANLDRACQDQPGKPVFSGVDLALVGRLHGLAMSQVSCPWGALPVGLEDDLVF